tara:strand:- start:448 stop:1290 length:843 start_codon:yes stop_codon:yes gene_type:complete
MSDYLKPNEFFQTPPKKTVEFIAKIVNWYFQPHILGLENLNKKQHALYVSNHTLLGLTDGPLYMPRLIKDYDIYLRPLADRMHKEIPLWRSIVTDYGAVEGSRANCERLMAFKQHILVFPGGTNEVCKTKGEEYKLQWQERFGFVKMAIENEYPIIPISGLGGDEIYNILFDKKEIMESKLGSWLKDTGIADKYFKGGSIIPPIVRGVGPTLIPKPQPIFYAFGKPIDTSKYKGDASEKNLKEARKKVEEAIYKGMEELKVLREEKASEMSAWRKFMNRL